MASKNFRSTLLEPTSEFSRGDKISFTALSTTGSVFNGSFSEIVIGDSGQYSVDLQYGKYRIDYKPYEGVWQKFANVEVNADTLATSLQSLALSSMPVTDDTILTLQSLLADAEGSAASSASSSLSAAASAASAAEDAAKLADVTPDSIGAVSAEGSVILRPEQQRFYFNLTSDKSIKITLPEASNASTIIALIEMSISTTTNLGTGSNEWVKLSFGGYHFQSLLQWISPALTVTGGSSAISFTTEQASDEWSIILTRAGGWASSSVTIDKITLVGTDSGWATGWTMSEVDTPASLDTVLAKQHTDDLFNSEKSIATQVLADYQLGLYSMTEQDVTDTRLYIQSIEPLSSSGGQRDVIPRPQVFSRYKKNPYEP